MLRVALAQINVTVGDLPGNARKIIDAIEQAKARGAECVLFSELTLTGYPPEDFLLLPDFVQAALQQLEQIARKTQGIIAIVGTPRWAQGEKKLYNSAAVIQNGEVIGFQDKWLLPTYDVFDERRYFEPGREQRLWELNGYKVAITICEDIWQHGEMVKETTYERDPVKHLGKPDLLLNLSASPYNPSQEEKRQEACKAVAESLHCPVYFCNQIGANDSLIFDGGSFVVDKEGNRIGVAKHFEEDLYLLTDPSARPLESTEALYQALCLGVRDYFQKQGFTKACLGLSGGVDSALVACIAVEALGKENVLAVAMPSRYSSQESYEDAHTLAARLGMMLQEIPIEKPFCAFLDLLQPFFEEKKPDTTEENIQARIRAIILMALSNKLGYILLSTGNKSELAMGYSTLYGDLSGGLAVISDVTKQQVYALARWINIIPERILTKPPSAELKPNQKDSDTLPDYAIIDRVLRLYLEEHCSVEEIVTRTQYERALVQDLIRRIHSSEYKRRQSPPGLRVSEKAFTVGRKFPIVQKWVLND